MLSIRKAGHRELEKYYPMMELHYAGELLGKLSIHRSLTKGDMELLILSDRESGDLAYALVMCRGVYDYGLVKYLSVLPWQRERNCEREFTELIHDRYATLQGLIYPLPAGESSPRRHLLLSLGCEDSGVTLTIGGQRTELLVKPLKGTSAIAPAAARIVTELYSRCVGRIAAEKLVKGWREGREMRNEG